MRISELTYDDEPIEPEYCVFCGHEPLDELVTIRLISFNLYVILPMLVYAGAAFEGWKSIK